MNKKKKKYYNNHLDIPYLLFADKDGNIYDHPDLLMAGMSYDECVCPSPEELVSLPFNSKLFFLPETKPVGYDPLADEYVVLDTIEIEGEEVECFAVSVFLTPGYARLYLPAADYAQKKLTLPLWSYTAVGVNSKGEIRACAFKIEENRKWDPKNYDDRKLLPKVDRLVKEYPENRLLGHLKKCATEYHCFAGKNMFLRRWEAPLPVSRSCNSKCLGCISLQEKESGCTASHERIAFKPTVKEIAELSIAHLEEADEAMVSFGQGCEGEPLTEWELILEAIKEIRAHTKKGSINLNTNGSMPDKVAMLIDAGLNSIRVSLNSASQKLYNAYFRPVSYTFSDVAQTIRLSKEKGIFTMINYLIFPGVNDTEEEYESLRKLIITTKLDFIHFKNLCIDPVLYIDTVSRGEGDTLGIRGMFELLRNEFPDVEIGYFNKNVSRYVGYE
jgi:pyruvate-formate lyase-activating enzyme